MLLNNIKINTVSVFLFSVIFIWLFFFCKHDPQLSESMFSMLIRMMQSDQSLFRHRSKQYFFQYCDYL